MLSGNRLRQTVHTHRASVHKAAKLVAALLRVAMVTADPAESNGNLYTHTHPFNGPFSGTTWVSRYQKGKTNLDFTEARDSEWLWHQLRHTQVPAPSSRQLNMPAPHHSVFYRPDALPAAQPTSSKHWIHKHWRHNVMATYRWIYDSHHLQADCQEPGSAPESYARQSSKGYLYLFTVSKSTGWPDKSV